MRAMLADPTIQAELAHVQMVTDTIPVPVLFVHIGQADLASSLDQTKLRVRVKYGAPGNCMRQATKTTQAARSENGAQVLCRFGEIIAFPERTAVAQVLRIRLEKVGLFDQVISKTEINLNQHTNETFTHDICLFGNGLGRQGELVGQLQVTTCLRYISRGELLGRGPMNVPHLTSPSPQYGDHFDAEYEAAIAESLRMSNPSGNDDAQSDLGAVAAPLVAGHVVAHATSAVASSAGENRAGEAPLIVQGRIVR